jgi:DNA polymerase
VRKVHLDFETYSEADLRAVGAFKYAEHPSTEIVVAAWAFDHGPVHSWCTGQPEEKLAELCMAIRKGAIVSAHNAMFEQVIWNVVMRRQFGASVPLLPIKQVDCTAARAAMCSLPRSLDGVGTALQVDITKDKRGAELVRFFTRPRKATKKDTSPRNHPKDFPEKFQAFVRYCRTDVISERDVDDELPPLPPFERRVFESDALINQRGLPIDIALVGKAGLIVSDLAKRAKNRVNKLTSGINPTQRDKLLKWFAENGVKLENLQAKTVAALLKQKKIVLSDEIREILELRVEAAKASVKKLLSMARCTMADGRARGTLLYYGAHTGRWSGKLIQPQNFIRGLLDAMAQSLVFQLLNKGDADLFEILYDKPLYQIAQVMRGFIRASKGKRLIVVDYAQIEARVLAWLAQEETALAAYRRGDDRYVLMAAFLWGIKPSDVSKEQRRIAKNLVLGCGYGLGGKKFIEYCAKEDLVIDNELSERAVRAYRSLNPNTVKFWYDVERCAKAAVRNPGTRVHLRNLSFYCKGNYLTIRLPSGRELFYPEPYLVPTERFGKPDVELRYKTQVFKRWLSTGTYGGKLVENIVQAVARDIMCEGIWQLETHNYPVIGTVHDELISEKLRSHGSIKEAERIVAHIPKWATGCPISSEGFEAERYRK